MGPTPRCRLKINFNKRPESGNAAGLLLLPFLATTVRMCLRLKCPQAELIAWGLCVRGLVSPHRARFRIIRLNTLVHLFVRRFGLFCLNIIHLLQVKPELRRDVEVAPKPDGSINGNGGFALQNLPDPSLLYINTLSKA